MLKELADVLAAPIETPAIDVAFNVERGKEYAAVLREIAEAFRLGRIEDEGFHRAAEDLAAQFGVTQASVEQRIYDMIALGDATNTSAKANEAGAESMQKLRAGLDDGTLGFQKVAEGANKAARAVSGFAKTEDELKDWKDSTKASFRTFVTRRELLVGEEDVNLRQAMSSSRLTAMENRARDLARAMREIKNEDWINP